MVEGASTRSPLAPAEGSTQSGGAAIADVGAVTVGVDYGTLSGRAVVVRVSDGAELGSAVHEYPHAVVTDAVPGHDTPLPPDWALQVPDDYVQVLKLAVPAALAAAGVDPSRVIGIGTDFTACTMVPTLADGTPLCELPEYADPPDADGQVLAPSRRPRPGRPHQRTRPATRRILAAEVRRIHLFRVGVRQGLELLENDRDLYDRMEHWVEAADWIVWQLCGEYVRNACTAGYKGIRQDGEYPSREFLAALNPDFADFVDTKLDHAIGALGSIAGRLTAQAAAWTGLPEGIAVAVGNVDAHVSAPAANAIAPGQMVAITGTSTCHVMNGSELREVPGMCGVVDGGITDGLWGYEAGQSGVGDIFGWFVRTGVPAEYSEKAAAQGISVHEHLTALAAEQPIGAHGLIALDWHSGNRSVLVDHELSGLIVGQTLATKPEDTYRALLEATAFGTRTIIETFTAAGVPVTELVIVGGLIKNKLLMQIYSDVTNLPLSIATSTQGPAVGSAIHAAVAAGAYPDVATAAAAMGDRQENAYRPIAANVQKYDALFAEYSKLHDYSAGSESVMRSLKEIKRVALSAATPDQPQRAEADIDTEQRAFA